MASSRRQFMIGAGATAVAMATFNPAEAFSGAINANSEGLVSGSADDQGAKLQRILEKASKTRKPVFIQPGRYRISRVTLPSFTNLSGVSGSTILEYTGRDHFLYSENSEFLSVSGLDLDGRLMPIKEYAEAVIGIREAKHISIEDCHITNSSQSGIYAANAAGQINKNRIDNAVGVAGFFGHNNKGLTIANNLVEKCANGGILVHRISRGEDDSIVTNNRIRQISAINGGTGQWGNGINTYLADGVSISDNHISDCAFSAVRSNSCSNIQISDNTCLRSGETSIYSEFAYHGAKVTGNLVDGGVSGISMANFNEGGRLSVCSGNLIRNIHSNISYDEKDHIHGIGISLEADTVASSNVIENAKNFGFLLGWGPYLRNVIVSGNIVRKSRTGVYVSVVEGSGPTKIVNNIFSGVTKDNIAGYRWHDQVTDDLAKAPPRAIEGLEISGNQTT